MKKILRLYIPKKLVDEPVIYKMITTYNLKPNIINASLKEQQAGEVLLEIEGTPADVERGILYFKEKDIRIEDLTNHDHADSN